MNPCFLAFFSMLVIFGNSTQLKSQYLVSTELLDTFTAAELNIVPGLVIQFDVEFFRVIYNTTGANGEATIASGAFARPIGNCSLFPIAVYQHGTTLNKNDVPSRNNAEAAIPKLLGGLGYYALAPDYIGMGDSPGLHPYVHSLTEATAGVDMIRAVREFLSGLGESDNGEVLISGYSQGGHAAMAMHKYIEENDLLDEFNVVAAAPASGPYDLSGSQTPVILSDTPYSNPGYIVYTLASYDLVYGDIYDTYSDVLQSPYDGIVVPYFDGNNVTYTMANLNPLLPNVVSELMTAEELADFQTNPLNPFKLALEDNDNYDWTPQRPIRMYYCTADEQVNFQNSLTAAATMQANGAVSVNAIMLGPLNHSDCFLPAMLGAINWFQATHTPCVVSGLDEHSFTFGISPNPARELLKIDSEENFKSLSISDLQGRRVIEKTFESESLVRSIDVSSLEKGAYVITLWSAEGRSSSSVFQAH